MIKKTLYAWKPQEPSSDFAEKVMARLLADPPPHLCTGAANMAVKSLGLKSMALTLAAFIVPILVILGLLLRAQLIQYDTPTAPHDVMPRIEPSNERPSPAFDPAPSNGPGESSGAASRDVHPGARSALPNGAPGGKSKGVTPSIRARGKEGSSPGEAASEPQPGAFNEKGAHASLEKALQGVKASCRALAGADGRTGFIKAYFYPEGALKLKAGVSRDMGSACDPADKPDDVSEEQSDQALVDCIVNNLVGVQAQKFDGKDKVEIKHPFNF